MSSRTVNYNSNDGCAIPLLLLGGCALAVLLITMAVNTNSHADRHSSAETIRKCDNILEIWIDKDCRRYHMIKQLDGETYGDHIVESSDDIYQAGVEQEVNEVTAFIPKRGILNLIREWLAKQGATKVWP